MIESVLSSRRIEKPSSLVLLVTFAVGIEPRAAPPAKVDEANPSRLIQQLGSGRFQERMREREAGIRSAWTISSPPRSSSPAR